MRYVLRFGGPYFPMLTESALSLGLRGPLVSFSVDPPTYLHSLLSSPSSPVSTSSTVSSPSITSPSPLIPNNNFQISGSGLNIEDLPGTICSCYFYSRMFCILFHSSSSASCYPIPSCCAFAHTRPV